MPDDTLTYWFITRKSRNGSDWYWNCNEAVWHENKRKCSPYYHPLIARLVAREIGGLVVRVSMRVGQTHGTITWEEPYK